jgi:long-chain acyl-CoA synthetase
MSGLPFALPDQPPGGAIEVFARRAIVRRRYAELFADVRHARIRLAAAGLARGDIVGLLGENCYEWIVHDLALVAMGCIPVAFPETYGDLDADDLAERFELSLLLTTRRFARAPRPWLMVIDAPEPSAEVRQPAAGEIRALGERGDLCAVIFSSGSSGELKAIALSQGGVESVFDNFVAGFDIGPGDRIFVALPLSIFQQRVLIYAALRAGADICFTDPTSLFHGLRALSPSIVLAPPSLFEAIEDRDEDVRQIEAAFGGRPRLLLTGSAPSRASTLAFFAAAGIPIFQIYGMAEVGFIAWNRPGANCPGTVGRPIHPHAVTIASDGEIIVAVPQRQAIGYLGSAKVNEADVFLTDGRVATGDLGRIDHGGNLVIEGRKKDLIVTRSGRKLAVRPLEVALEALTGIDRAVLVGGGELPWPVAVLVAEAGLTTARRIAAEQAAAEVIEAHNDAVERELRVAKWVWADAPFTAENGLLTRNLKLDRVAIRQRFADALLETGA